MDKLVESPFLHRLYRTGIGVSLWNIERGVLERHRTHVYFLSMSHKSIVFGIEPKGNNTVRVPPEVASLGLNLVRMAPCDWTYSVQNRHIQTAYSQYISHLPDFARAIESQSVVYFRGSNPRVIGNLAYEHTILLRPVTFVTQFKSMSAQKVKFIESRGFMSNKIGKEVYYIKSAIEPEDMKLIKDDPTASTKCYAPINCLNYDQCVVLSTVRKILSWVLQTMQYPAEGFPEDDVVDTDEDNPRRTSTIPPPPVPPRNLPTVVESKEDLPLVTSFTVSVVGAKRARSEIARTRQTYHVVLTKAKPSPLRISYARNISDIPNQRGIFCRYIPELAKEDYYSVCSIITSMSTLTGNSIEAIQYFQSLLTHNWNHIASSENGKEYSHIAKVILIAQQCQSVCIPVYTNKVYQGCVIAGDGWTIVADNKVYEPLSYDEIIASIIDANQHSSSLERIRVILDEPVETMRGIKKSISNKGDLTREAIDELKKLLPRLNFQDPFVPFTTDDVCNHLNLLADPAIEIPDEVAMHHTAVFQEGREWDVLSAFGSSAPTFNIQNSSMIKLSVKDCPESLVFRRVALERAVSDMLLIKSKRSVQNNPKSLNTTYADKAIKDSDLRTQAWRNLITYATSEVSEYIPETKATVSTDFDIVS